MKKKLTQLFLATFVGAAFIFSMQSCSSDDNLSDAGGDTPEATSEDIATIDADALSMMKQRLTEAGLDLSALDENLDPESRAFIFDDIMLRVIKISCKSPHPDGSGRMIDASGVLIVPRKAPFTSLTNYRILVAPAPTYTMNSFTPSQSFKNGLAIHTGDELNYLYFYTIFASKGFAVFLPDYPGFGDSYQQCTMPYLESKTMTANLVNLVRETQRVLTKNKYRYKKDLVVTGMSQGGFIAASFVRAIETNPAYGLSANLLYTAGTPCNLKQIIDLARAESTLPASFLFPYAMVGYKYNSYPMVNMQDVLKEPYASQAVAYMDGKHTAAQIQAFFPSSSSALFTDNFRLNLDTDPNLAYLNQILDENSVKPWRNRCDFIMLHGAKDKTVHYENARDFAAQQNQIGGKVIFNTTLLLDDHGTSAIPYFASCLALYPKYK